ncbi:hypothetical protein BD289DRAFT_442922 [Coniella lustricola]|uniref:Uncharacterized protein n=1 Tax=Coniella lustricola TaxID=2025994 RepID=A0A2T2ZXR6_9PEZI|nr:hypothetical protein BD289DRAFT_442922 [Coniella lustricola]
MLTLRMCILIHAYTLTLIASSLPVYRSRLYMTMYMQICFVYHIWTLFYYCHYYYYYY